MYVYKGALPMQQPLIFNMKTEVKQSRLYSLLLKKTRASEENDSKFNFDQQISQKYFKGGNTCF